MFIQQLAHDGARGLQRVGANADAVGEQPYPDRLEHRGVPVLDEDRLGGQ